MLTFGVQKIVRELLVQKWCCVHPLGILSDNNSDGYEMLLKKRSRTASNFIALIPSCSICQMLAICSRVEV